MTASFKAVVVVAALVAGLTGCASGAVSPAPHTTSGAVLDMHILDVLTRSGTWAESERVLTAADDRLTQRCMQERGFRYPVDQRTATGNDDETAVIDLPRRRRVGYGLTDTAGSMPQDPPSAVDAYVRSLPAAEQERFRKALFGTADDGAPRTLKEGSV
jgi:hypothetical protein